MGKHPTLDVLTCGSAAVVPARTATRPSRPPPSMALHALLCALAMAVALPLASANYLLHTCPCFCSERDSGDSSYYRDRFGLFGDDTCLTTCQSEDALTGLGLDPLAYVTLPDLSPVRSSLQQHQAASLADVLGLCRRAQRVYLTTSVHVFCARTARSCRSVARTSTTRSAAVSSRPASAEQPPMSAPLSPNKSLTGRSWTVRCSAVQ